MRSLRAQVLLVLTVVLVLGLGITYVITSRLTHSAVIDARVEHAMRAMSLVAGRFDNTPGEPFAMAEALAVLRPRLAPDSLYLLDPELRPVVDAPDSPAAAELARSLDPADLEALIAEGQDHGIVRSPAGDRLLVATTTLGHGLRDPTGAAAEVPLRVCLISDLAPTLARIEVHERLLLLFTGTVLALALVIGYLLLGRTVVRPLQRLVRTIERIGGGQFAATIGDPGSTGEVGQLYGAFDKMTARLEADRRSIERKVRQLEDAKRDLEHAQDQLVRTQKLASVGKLAAGVAHEIGNPIAVVQGYTEILRDPDLEQASRDAYLTAVDDSIARVSTIIRDLLDFARPTDETRRECDLAEVVRSTAKLVEPQRRFRGLSLELELPESPVRAAATAGRIEQVLLNLLFNAADASPPDGTIRVELEQREEAGEVAVVVSDQGPGVPASIRSEIFDPFFTTKDPGAGTGLGLAICHSILQSYGGRVTVGDAEGGGARFELVLPRWGS